MAGRNQMPNPPSKALERVCDQKECIEKGNKACQKMLACGHECFGIKEEPVCLPCLKSDCAAAQNEEKMPSPSKRMVEDPLGVMVKSVWNMIIAKKKPPPPPAEALAAAHRKANESYTPKRLTQSDEDLCMFCQADDLGSEPCIQVQCGHVFHFGCVRDRLEAKWPGQRVGFNFLTCPLCNTEMMHPALQDLLEPVFAMRDSIFEKIRKRIEVEDLDKDERVVDPNSRYYNDAFQYGLDVYAFYLCNNCEDPFFGGRRDCEANAEGQEANPDELICNSCAELGQGNCGLDGHDDYVLWKCRYCCEGAIWFCWGTTHFCNFCHSNDPWGRAKGTAPGQTERAKCPPEGKDKCPCGLQKKK